MRILHVITTLDVGGAEMHIRSQVQGQVAAGHSVRVAYLKGQGTLADDFRGAGAEWVGSVSSGPGIVFALFAHLRWAELIHSHLLKADMATAVLATLYGRRSRLVAGKHNDEQVLKRPLVSFVHGLLGNLPRKTIVLSDHVGEFVRRYGRVSAKKIERVYYGIDPEPFEKAADATADTKQRLCAELGLAPEDIVFTCVARFAAQKAHDVLLEAFAEARKETPNLRLLLVGGDPFGDGVERAKAHAIRLQLGDAVIFAGIRRDVPELLAISDVFVMSSLWEGLGLVFLEAMATGIPVLATRVSAVPEVVVENETGVLVRPSDVPDLARGFTELATNAALRERLGMAGRARVHECFGLERMVQETLAIYSKVAGEELR